MRNRKKATVNKEKRARLNSADVMIFLLCVLCIAGMVFRFVALDKIENEATAQTATVALSIEGISDTSVPYLSSGTEMYLEDGTTVLGSINSVVATPSIVHVCQDDGTIVSMESVNGKLDIRIELAVSGVMTEAGFMLGGTTYIAPNMTLPVKTSALSVSTTVMDVKIAE